MRLGYSTNSLGDIPPLDALPILRDLGYASIAITPDHHLLDPFADSLADELGRWRKALAAHGMACVIETGARHLLDPLRKHEPTLVSAEREGRLRRVEFLRRAIDIAAELEAGCVSLWAGAVRDAADDETIWRRLVDGLEPVLDHAAGKGIPVGFEPEPGMFIDTCERYRMLLAHMGDPEPLRLTVDIGHMECMGERPAAAVLHPWVGRIVNVHADDMLACRHEHIPFGTGDVDFAPVLATLAAGDYAGGIHVELPRQSHRWLETARAAAKFLAPAIGTTAR
jgi:L-ribulose-5-phosphate 3-epimerase